MVAQKILNKRCKQTKTAIINHLRTAHGFIKKQLFTHLSPY